MMPTRTQASRDREAYIARESTFLDARIERAQNKLFRTISDIFLASLAADAAGIIQKDSNHPYIPYRLDQIFDQYRDETIAPIVTKMQGTFEQIANKNGAYFSSFTENDQDENVKASVFSTLGITGGIIAAGSILSSILQDRSAINTIKSVVMAAVSGGMTITALKVAVEEIVLRKDGGLIKKLFHEKAPDPFYKVDRYINTKYGVALKLNYAIYQGGQIKTSRPFCIHRNNKVFSRDEILRFGTPSDTFGGYENISTGDFQGKTDPYNPVTDLGGYNCRHHLHWISDELAYALRPDLKG